MLNKQQQNLNTKEFIEPITQPNDIKLGIALGSGSARGWAHIGVLQALTQIGIKPYCVAGCSIGALVGAAYACGHLDTFATWAKSLKWRDVLSAMDFSFGHGFMKSHKLLTFLHQYLDDGLIEELAIPFATVATRLDNGKEVWLRKGSILDAVKASTAFPGLFPAVHLDNKWLIDGGLVNPVPVSLCLAMGADMVIAVDLNVDLLNSYQEKFYIDSQEDRANSANLGFWAKVSNYFSAGQSGIQSPGMINVMSCAVNIMQYRITRGRMSGDPPDILLAPQLGKFGMLDFHRANEAITEGESVVYHTVRRLRHILQ